MLIKLKKFIKSKDNQVLKIKVFLASVYTGSAVTYAITNITVNILNIIFFITIFVLAISFISFMWVELFASVLRTNIIIKFKNWQLNNRINALSLGVIFGMLFSYIFFKLEIISDTRINASITIIILSLFVLTQLWFFRTTDTKEQIQKTQDNLNMAIFNNAIKLLGNATIETNKDKQKSEVEIAIRQLFYLRNNLKSLQYLVDSITQNLGLTNLDLSQEDLTNANLKNAILSKANLCNTDLRGANLKNAELDGATYNQDTRFPKGFDPKGAGMIFVKE